MFHGNHYPPRSALKKLSEIATGVGNPWLMTLGIFLVSLQGGLQDSDSYDFFGILLAQEIR